MTAIRLFLVMTLLTGLMYPLCITGISQILFHEKSNGSIIFHHGKPVGSLLISQEFKSDRYFWSRPSAIGFNTLPSGGSNLSPSSKKYKAQLNPQGCSELWMSSGSGLDPHLTPQAILYQLDRIVQARHLSPVQKAHLITLIQAHTEWPDWGLFGESRINVLALNLALDRLQ